MLQPPHSGGLQRKRRCRSSHTRMPRNGRSPSECSSVAQAGQDERHNERQHDPGEKELPEASSQTAVKWPRECSQVRRACSCLLLACCPCVLGELRQSGPQPGNSMESCVSGRRIWEREGLIPRQQSGCPAFSRRQRRPTVRPGTLSGWPTIQSHRFLPLPAARRLLWWLAHAAPAVLASSQTHLGVLASHALPTRTLQATRQSSVFR